MLIKLKTKIAIKLLIADLKAAIYETINRIKNAIPTTKSEESGEKTGLNAKSGALEGDLLNADNTDIKRN